MTRRTSGPLWLVACALSLGAGVIHFALGPEHVAELGALGYGFYLSGALQVGWALAFGALLLPGAPVTSRAIFRSLALAGITINVAILGAWALSRIVGLPAGDMPWTPEAVGRPDAIAGILETLLVVGLIGALRTWSIGGGVSSRRLAAGAGIALSAVMIGTVFAIAPDGPGHEDVHHGGAAMIMAGEAGPRR